MHSHSAPASAGATGATCSCRHREPYRRFVPSTDSVTGEAPDPLIMRPGNDWTGMLASTGNCVKASSSFGVKAVSRIISAEEHRTRAKEEGGEHSQG